MGTDDTPAAAADSCCILFAKYPEPGRTKTRLQPWCTPQAAARLYRAFVLDTVATLQGAAVARRVLAFDPPDCGAAMARLTAASGPCELVPQPDGDLGQRLAAVARSCFAEGVKRAVLIGADAPSMPSSHIDAALAQLLDHDVVLGPSTDGGYYLLGLRHDAGLALFEHIDWSTGRVLAQTLQRLGPLSLALLPPWYDVDTPRDAGLLHVHLRALHRAGQRRAPHSLAALEELRPPLPGSLD